MWMRPISSQPLSLEFFGILSLYRGVRMLRIFSILALSVVVTIRCNSQTLGIYRIGTVPGNDGQQINSLDPTLKTFNGLALCPDGASPLSR